MLVYRESSPSNQIPQFKTHDSSGFGTEDVALDVGGPLTYIIVRAKPDPSSNEKVLCAKDSGNDVNCQVWNGTTWGNLFEVTTNTGIDTRIFNVAYEMSSGRAMVCYRSQSAKNTPNCDIWDGTDWNTAADASAISTGGIGVETFKLIPDPNSNEIALITKDSADDINVQIWSGSAWGNLIEVETDAGTCARCFPFHGAWESSSGDFVVVWFDNGSDEVQSREFTTSWQTEKTGVITGLDSTGDLILMMAAGNPDSSSNQILIAMADDADDLDTNLWDGSAWGTSGNISTNIGTVTDSNHLFFLNYEHASDFDAVITYGETAASLKYRVWDTGTTAWGSEQDLPTPSGNAGWYTLAADPNTQNLMLALLTNTGTADSDDVDTLEWSGSSWEAGFTNHETASNATFWNAFFAYDFEDETTLGCASLISRVIMIQ